MYQSDSYIRHMSLKLMHNLKRKLYNLCLMNKKHIKMNMVDSFQKNFYIRLIGIPSNILSYLADTQPHINNSCFDLNMPNN